MIDPADYLGAYNDLHGRMIAAAGDRSVSPETIRQWEREALDMIEESFRAAGYSISREPEYTRLQHTTSIKLGATNALGIRRQWGMGDAVMTRAEQASRLGELRQSYLRLREINPGIFGDAYSDELRFIDHELKFLRRTSTSPVGCLILLALLVIVVVLIVK